MTKMLIMAVACLMAAMTFAAQYATTFLDVTEFVDEIQQHFSAM